MKSVLMALVLVAAATLAMPAAQAGCSLNVFVKNTGQVNVKVHVTVAHVKTKGGSWLYLSKGGWFLKTTELAPAGQTGDNYAAKFGCGVNRRYKVQYSCLAGAYHGQIFTAYYPSSTTWTKSGSPVISLGACKK